MKNIKHPVESVYPDINKMSPEIQKIEVSNTEVQSGEFFWLIYENLYIIINVDDKHWMYVW